jgi:hypothetical protein
MLIAVDNYLAKITMGVGCSPADEKEHKLYSVQRRVRIIMD